MRRNKGSLVRWALTAWLLWLVWKDLQSWKLVLVLTMITIAIEINSSLHNKTAEAIKILTTNQKKFNEMIAMTNGLDIPGQEDKKQ